MHRRATTITTLLEDRRLRHFRFLDCARGAEAELTLFVAQGIGRVDPGNFEGWQERGQHGHP